MVTKTEPTRNVCNRPKTIGAYHMKTFCSYLKLTVLVNSFIECMNVVCPLYHCPHNWGRPKLRMAVTRKKKSQKARPRNKLENAFLNVDLNRTKRKVVILLLNTILTDMHLKRTIIERALPVKPNIDTAVRVRPSM